MHFQTILAVASATILAFGSGAAARRVMVLPIQIYQGNNMILELKDQIAGGTAYASIHLRGQPRMQQYPIPISKTGNPDPSQLPPGYTAIANRAGARVVDLLPDGSVPGAGTGGARSPRSPRRRLTVPGVTDRLGR
ncbi:hypothetical protein MCOR27_005094 [Pyricularia oryzae]|uniref:Uncharacterized protein n=3 Tax=Pyricularia TaxID=48558 RepID=A0ABQ8NFC0_PYRGI|nr:hypothetical protein OOU_Y34scaffold00519g23 [Pyricularia oryzae Y34]KAH8843075.1 hypothetical protein MCOR01_003902 [Pyricularia oryzae]KAI6296037.1 hypothetical protein MCOR33_007235 [Pyricularia grisea]KAH9430527.1 hypothetical protein MCOR02_007862 [Pyricularia oryzae]KAI6258066.1 hypothetical protein MCOR19_005516 [Pyricularia oryzae]